MVKRIQKLGVAVEGRTPPLASSLPRMDVAGFVGFVHATAALHERPEPVAIESARELEACFGPDFTVDGWRGQLGPSVRAFFANGGRRAIIVGVPASYGWTVRPERLVDARLAGLTVAQLREEATRLWAEGERPRGLHALMDNDELTLLCVPDAALAAPVSSGGLTLHLTLDSAPAAEVSKPTATPAPGAFRPLRVETPLQSPARPAPVWSPSDSPRRLQRGSSSAITLTWTTPAGPLPDRWEVQRGWDGEPDASSGPLERVHSPALTLEAEEREQLLRVRGCWGEERGPWSGAARVRLEADPVVTGTPDPLRLAALHRCLLRVALARGDALALLSLPMDAGPHDVSRHLRLLDPALPEAEQLDIELVAERAGGGTWPRSGRPQRERSRVVVPRWSWDERERVLSAGALYHPWIAHVGRGAEAVPTPPDGPVAGLVARRSLETGCWAAPANQVLSGALGVHSAWLEPVWTRWEAKNPREAQRLNRLSTRLGGVRPLRANTLQSPTEHDPDGAEALWRGEPLSARRLLALLRRLALREGQAWVFAPAGLGTAASMRAAFNGHLHRLFLGGAFAGATAATSYEVIVRVDTGDTAPRLEVDLRVAPVRPLEFVTVRLIQRDPRGQPVVEG